MRAGVKRAIRLRPAAALSILLLGWCATVLAAPPRAAAAARQGGEAAAVCAQRALLDASFVQPTTAAAARPRDEWEALFADAAAIGLEEVFVQWTLADGVRFFPAPPGPLGEAMTEETSAAVAASGRTVETLLELAQAHGMRLWVGLAHDPGWWTGIDRSRPATEVEVFLARRRLENLAVAKELAPLVAEGSAFAGWYVPDEIDDRNWLGDDRRRLVVQYLTDLAAGLHEVAPGSAVAVSGFGQGWATPGQLARLWSAILAPGGVELLLFQDGVGAEKLSLHDLEVYLPPLAAAAGDAGARLGIVVELFSMADAAAGGSASGTPDGARSAAFRAVPAPLERIERQLLLAKRFATGPRVGFSVPDYMSPFGGSGAASLYEGYRALAARCASAR